MKSVLIIVPAYNESRGLITFYECVSKILKEESERYDISYLFVNDGSRDDTIEIIHELAGQHADVNYISFSRNFGKEAAIYAGLSHSEADMTILMDADLQHPPELISQMLELVDSGEYDACGAKRVPGLMSRLFNRVNNALSEVKLETGATDFMCMNRKFVDAVMQMTETQRFTKGLFAWVGFKVKWLDYVQGPRAEGESKWSFRKLVSYALDGITGFSVIPLKLVSWAGAIICLLAVIYIIRVLIKTWVHGIDVPGYVTTLVSVLFLGGILLLGIGILGSYIGRIFMESKHRPIYLADEISVKSRKEEKGTTSSCQK